VRRFAAAWWQVPAAILLAAVTWRTTSLLAEAGLDNSWEQALHLTWTRGVHFGTGFAWTYGPLGFLAFPRAVDGGTLAAAVLFVAHDDLVVDPLMLERLDEVGDGASDRRCFVLRGDDDRVLHVGMVAEGTFRTDGGHGGDPHGVRLT